MAVATLGAAVLGLLVPTVSRAESLLAAPVAVRLAAAPAALPAKSTTAAKPGALAILLGRPEAAISISRVSDEHDLADAPVLGSVSTAPADRTSVLSSGFVRPVEGAVSSRYGLRFHPILQVWKLHTGTDIGAACGTPVKAVKDGVVSFAGAAGGDGNRVIVDHGQGLATTYNHLSSYAAAAGMPVRQGQIIGYVGTTGLSTGCHLHFEVMVNGLIVDSGPYLDLAAAPAVTIPAAVAPTTAVSTAHTQPARKTPPPAPTSPPPGAPSPPSPPPATHSAPRPPTTPPPTSRPPTTATTSTPPPSSTTSTSGTATSGSGTPSTTDTAPSSTAPTTTSPTGTVASTSAPSTSTGATSSTAPTQAKTAGTSTTSAADASTAN